MSVAPPKPTPNAAASKGVSCPSPCVLYPLAMNMNIRTAMIPLQTENITAYDANWVFVSRIQRTPFLQINFVQIQIAFVVPLVVLVRVSHAHLSHAHLTHEFRLDIHCSL